MPQEKYEGEGVEAPHDHDVLSGRGNFVNYHAGNEYFRALVRKYKNDYVKCPKPQKGKFSKIIVDEISARDPPGRFLKQDPATKLWHDIGEKKALDKTRQALREGAPDIMKEMSGESGSDGEAEGDERPITTKKKTSKNTSNASSFRNNMGSPGGMFPGDSMSQMAFMQNSMNMSSPVMARNALQMGGMAGFSPTIPLSPGLGMSPAMSVGMMMTPDMQLSAQQTQMQNLSSQMNNNNNVNMPMSQAIPPPPMSSTDNTPQQQTHKMTPQQQMANRQQQMQLQLQQEKMMMQQR
eukprot:CAMPEP_0113482374 /NCGR_PEP_ID=MMETSP0014_2-20120614/22885_1 /TAXON_ID=2857 /ORGANISM="Nitzschia sp." /LENGTH=293 /DNA_ID=CAMNT_0000375887 /DNA_START=367 /DNA_END=1245 /DNA_ORIENTATION=+ /assembly_acc=CAM_ASM_000159